MDWGGWPTTPGVAGQLWLPPGCGGVCRPRCSGWPTPRERRRARGRLGAAAPERAEAHVDAPDAGGDRPVLWYEHVVLPHALGPGHTGDEYRTDGAHASGLD